MMFTLGGEGVTKKQTQGTKSADVCMWQGGLKNLRTSYVHAPCLPYACEALEIRAS